MLASYWTIAGRTFPHTDREYSPFDFKDRVESAAAAGFKGLGLWHADIDYILQRRTLQEMKAILDDNGMKYVELEFLSDWFLEGERKKQSDLRKQKLLRAAEVMQAKHIKVGDFYREECPMPRLIETFAALCEEAANHGTKIGFELMPFAMIDTLPDALRLVEGTDGGIVFDLWHLVKLRIPFEEVARVPARHVLGIELNDGTLEAPWSLHEDTVNHRRFCGEGEFDVQGFVACMRTADYRGPWGIEVLSEEAREMPLEELTTRAFQTTMAQFRPTPARAASTPGAGRSHGLSPPRKKA
ncbi:MAG: sugar phosphate isomerase/epimerase [Acidobacteriia bacterium]|nr:sugar phosphate isomerase/epimerase [Terriglobia bacterium]